MSGAARLSTTMSASASNFDCGSVGSRFSTLNVATASCFGAAGRPTSATVSPEMAAGTDVGYIRQLLKP